MKAAFLTMDLLIASAIFAYLLFISYSIIHYSPIKYDLLAFKAGNELSIIKEEILGMNETLIEQALEARINSYYLIAQYYDEDEIINEIILGEPKPNLACSTRHYHMQYLAKSTLCIGDEN